MVSLDPNDRFIFCCSIAAGLLAGIAGNWFVTSFFRILYRYSGKPPIDHLTMDWILFISGLFLVGYIIYRLMSSLSEIESVQ